MNTVIATLIVILWLVLFSKAALRVIEELLYWLLLKPVELICKLFK